MSNISSPLSWQRLKEAEYDTYFDPSKIPALKRDFLLSRFADDVKQELLKNSEKLLSDRKKQYSWQTISDEIVEELCEALEKNLYPNMPTPEEFTQKLEKFAQFMEASEKTSDEVRHQALLMEVIHDLKRYLIERELPFLNQISKLHSELTAFEGQLEKHGLKEIQVISQRTLKSTKSQVLLLGKGLKVKLAQFYSIWAVLHSEDKKNTAIRMLPFYRDGDDAGLLVHIDAGAAGKNIRLVWLPNRKAIRVLDGKSDAMHEINGYEGVLNLRDTGHAEEYLNFFCNHICGDDGAFNIIEEAPKAKKSPNTDDLLTLKTEDLRLNKNKKLEKPCNAEIAMPIIGLRAVEIEGQNPIEENEDHLELVANVIYGTGLFRVLFKVTYANGFVEMIDDHPVDWCAISPLNLSWDALNNITEDLPYDDVVSSIHQRFPGENEKTEKTPEEKINPSTTAKNKKTFLKIPPRKWRVPTNDEKNGITEALSNIEEEGKAIANVIEAGMDVALKELPFYDSALLLHIEPDYLLQGQALRIILFVDENKYWTLDGGSAPIHEINSLGKLDINDETALEYLRFFCEHVHGELGPFYPIEKITENNDFPDFPKNLDISMMMQTGTEEDKVRFNQCLMLEIDENGEFQTNAKILYGESVFKAHFQITTTGMVEMLNDEAYGSRVSLIHSYVDWQPIDSLTLSSKGEGA